MKNMKSTKRSLFLSAMALLLCTSMLIGTTYAWFTESVSSVNNIITGGNLDVELEWSADGSTWKDVDANTNVFTSSLWEPGHTEVVYLKVSNVGDLALKYQLGVNVASETPAVNADGDQIWLSQYIKFGVVESGKVYAQGERAQAIADAQASAKLLKEGYSKSSTLYPTNTEKTTSETVALVVYMPETVGNEANYVGEVAPKINLGINLIATQFTWEKDGFDEYYDGGAKWLGDVDTSWYDASKTEFVIGNPEQLAGLAELVNTGVDSFAGKTVKLVSDLDLNNIEWTPIGDADADVFVGFKGTFDGQGHTISNLYINSASWGKGLFGYMDATTNATVKNVNVHNASVKASDCVGVIVGYATKGTFSNISVTGDVSIVGTAADGHVGGIAGCGYYASFDNCSVIANGEIVAGGSFVGGIVGYQCDNTKTIKNCSVEGLIITGNAAVGGIAGIVQTGGAAIDNCSVKNVTLNMIRVDGDPAIGALIGNYSGTAATTLTGKVENVILNGSHVAYSVYNKLYGSNYGGDETTPNFDTTGVTGTDTITNNLKVVVPVTDVAGLKTALTNGGNNYVLTKDIVVDKNKTLTVENGTAVTIDLNGHKITSTADKTGNQELFLVKGNLTVKNGSMEYAASNNQGWSSMITIFDVTAGGVLNMEKITANVGGSDMNFIVHLNNWGSATLNVNDCDFTASYVAIRAFNSGYDMNTVTVKNTAFHNGRVFWVHNYTAEGKDDSTLNVSIYGNGNTTDNAKPVRYGFSNSLYYTIEGKLLVSAANSAELAAALGTADKNTVIDATGVVFEGTAGLNINGATVVGATFKNDSGYAVSGTVNGTFKNCTFESGEALRWCYTTAGNTVVFENCVINTNFRGVHFDEMNGDVIFKNCEINGFNAFSGSGTMTFENCTFGHDKSSYNGLNIYTNTNLINCTFEFATGKTNFIDMEGTGKTLTITNCTATLDGNEVSVTDFVGGSKLAQNTVVVK